MAKSAEHAAQQGGGPTPAPSAPQHHTWSTPDEYAAQVNMPLHRMLAQPVVPADADPHYVTACGLVLGAEGDVIRVSDAEPPTCPKCKRSKKR